MEYVVSSSKTEAVMKIGWDIPLILKRMIEAVIVLAPLLMIALPVIIAPIEPAYVNTYISGSSQNAWVTLAFLEVCGALCWIILLLLQRMLTATIKDSPFVYQNVRYFKYISYLCALIALVLIVKTFVDFSILTPVVAVIAMLASLFCQTLAAVFDKAVRLKDENDLTI